MEKLKQLLKKKNISYGNLARELGVTRQSVYNWIYGNNYPSIKHLRKLSVILKTNLNELIPRE